jgi:hypothetical protein
MRTAATLGAIALARAKRYGVCCGGGTQFLASDGQNVSGLGRHIRDSFDTHFEDFENMAMRLLLKMCEAQDSEFDEAYCEFGDKALLMRDLLKTDIVNVVHLSDSFVANREERRRQQQTKADPSHQPPLPESPGGSGES